LLYSSICHTASHADGPMHIIVYYYWTLTCVFVLIFFFFNDTPTTEIYTLSLHDALPISDMDLAAKGLGAKEWNNSLKTKLSCSIDRKSGSAGMPRPISYAVFCLKKKKNTRHPTLFDRQDCTCSAGSGIQTYMCVLRRATA